MSITTVNLGKIRLNWRGPWVASTVYSVNDAVSYSGNSYICVSPNTSSASFATDLAAVYWQIMASGTSANTTTGDITYRGNAGSDVRLPAGSTGQVITMGSNGLPQWGNPNASGTDYYVSPNGADTNNGLSINQAFATLRKACASVTGPATIYVKAGTYNETLPITVPASVSIIGDGMRDTVITPITGSATATYTSAGSSGTTLVVSSTSGIGAGMTITGTGFISAQKVVSVTNSTTLVISANPDVTPAGTLTFTYLSTDASPVVNNLSTMFYLSDSTMLQGLLMTGMTGFSKNGSYPTDITQATIGGVYLRLNPSANITVKSPYVKDCTAKSSGGVGAIIDGATQTGGIKSMVFWAYNMVMDSGVGIWAANGGKVEAVSSFTYYAYIGYTASGGGQIRSVAGNNSYGTYGVIAEGTLSTETPVTANVYGGMLTFTQALSTGTFVQGETITQATSGATGIVTSVQTGFLYYYSTSGTFDTTHLVTGGTSSATMTPTAVGGQAGYVLVLSALSGTISAGASIQFATGDTSAYVVSAVSTATVNATALTIITLAQQKVTASLNSVQAVIRYNFSLIRLQSHDFLAIGTGGATTTNYPGLPTQGPTPANQISYTFPGRVYYVTTDELGNFNVGQYFSVNQATGSATLNASAFNLSGLTSLRLGSVGAQLGAQINEFTTDGTLSQNSNVKVPTEAAIITYLGAAYQNIAPATTNTYSSGTSSDQWSNVYSTLGTFSGALTAASITTSGNATINGNLTVNGTTITVSTGNVNVQDKVIQIGYVTPGTISTTGTIGSISGSGPWTATITGMTSTSDLLVGSVITATAGTGALNTGSGGVAVVTSIVSSSSITYTSTGGLTPTAGTVTTITTTGTSDSIANGGGLLLYGTTNKTFEWASATTSWNSSENLNLATGKSYEINGTVVLTASALLTSATTISIGASTGTTSINNNAFVANQFYVGTGSQSTTLTNALTVARGTSTTGAGVQYTQSSIINATSSGSSDWIAYGDNYPGPSSDHGWIDVGFTGSTFSDPNYTITNPNDGYVFAGAVSGSGATGNLVLATDSTGSTADIVLATGGWLAANEQWRFKNSTGALQFKTPTLTATTGTTATVFNTTVTTVNAYGAATTLNVGGAGTTYYLGTSSGNSTFSVLGNGTSGTTTITSNVTTGTANVFAGVTGIINIGQSGTTVYVGGIKPASAGKAIAMAMVFGG